MRIGKALLLLGIMYLLTSCTAQIADTGTKNTEPPKLNLSLKGSWNFWMRLDTESDNTLVKGTMVVQDEVCSAVICNIEGLILKPQMATIGTRLNFTGIALPTQHLIRLQFSDLNNRDDPILVIVEFDIFLANFNPERMMVGHFVMFNQSLPGPLNEDSSVLVEANRGELMAAGRVTAWPIVIKDPTLPDN